MNFKAAGLKVCLKLSVCVDQSHEHFVLSPRLQFHTRDFPHGSVYQGVVVQKARGQMLLTSIQFFNYWLHVFHQLV